MSCILPDRMESLTHSLAFDHAHFWALPLQDEQMIHRLELQATTGLVALSVNTQVRVGYDEGWLGIGVGASLGVRIRVQVEGCKDGVITWRGT
jgi:hypothetical protein